MYIAPNTNIRLLQSVPINNSYRDTLYFSSARLQEQYFISKTKYNLQNYSFATPAAGRLRVGISIGNLYDVNYIMFQNNSFSLKWFYAFVTDYVYINNECTEIVFEIDVIQSWFLSVGLRSCYIERNHTTDDTIGSNLQPEPVDLGEYTIGISHFSPHFTDWKAVLLSAYDGTSESGGVSLGQLSYGTINGLRAYLFNINQSGLNELRKFLEIMNANNLMDSIAAFYAVPAKIMPSATVSTSVILTDSVDKPTNLAGYTPVNNKLLTYPYNQLLVDTGDNGPSITYKYEDFSTNNCQFRLLSNPFPGGGVINLPTNYMGEATYYADSLIINDFPQLSLAVDTYKSWVAQNSVSILGSLAAGIAGMGAGVASSNPAQFIGGLSTTVSTLNDMSNKAKHPPATHSQGSGNIGMSNRFKRFNYYQQCIKPEFARKIDSFFSGFGYAINKIDVPQISNRPEFSYVKTVSANFVGAVPSDDLSKICSLFDNGIRFWKNPSNVGYLTIANKN